MSGLLETDGRKPVHLGLWKTRQFYPPRRWSLFLTFLFEGAGILSLVLKGLWGPCRTSSETWQCALDFS